MNTRWAMVTGLLMLIFTVLVITKPISQDEGVFLTIGKYLAQGDVLYRDWFDHKPPGIHFLFAGLFSVFGASLWVAKAALIASVAGSVVLIKKIGDRVKAGAGWLAAIFFLFLMTQFEGYYLVAESFMILPLLGATWLLVREKVTARSIWLAGTLLALSLFFKQTAIISILPLLWLALWRAKWRLPMLILGFNWLLLVFMIWLFAVGIFNEAWRQVVVLTLTQYPAEPFSAVVDYLRTNFLWTAPIWILFFLSWWPAVRNKRILLAMAVLPIPFMFFRHYPHYWIQILPVVAILAASVVADMRTRTMGIVLIVFCVAIIGGKIAQDAEPNMQKLHAQLATAEVMKEDSRLRGSDSNTRLLAENQFTGFYFLLPQRPLNRYLYLTEITAAENAEEKTIVDLQRANTVLVLWPTHDRAYAKKLEATINARQADELRLPDLELRVFQVK